MHDSKKKGRRVKNLRGAPALMHHFGVPVLFSLVSPLACAS
jgi:hypothetical protein